MAVARRGPFMDYHRKRLLLVAASVELEINDFVIEAKIGKVIFINFYLKKSSSFFLPLTFFLHLSRLSK